jgi:RNA polymerase sigma-B factor
LGWTLEQVLSALAVRRANSILSLDESDAEGLSLGDRLAAPEGELERLERRADLRKALETLSEAEREMLRLRFSLRLNQRETARRMNRTQMQISRMERRALAALRKEMEGEP